MWTLKPEWAGFIGPGPFTDEEFKGLCAAYAAAGGWTLEEVLEANQQYESKPRSKKVTEAATPQEEEPVDG